MTRWTREAIKILGFRGDSGPAVEEIDALVRRPFAVHQAVEDDDWFSITHLPTGLSVVNATGWFWSESDATRATDMMRPMFDAWETARPSRNGELDALRDAIRRALDDAGIVRQYVPKRQAFDGDIPAEINGYAAVAS